MLYISTPFYRTDKEYCAVEEYYYASMLPNYLQNNPNNILHTKRESSGHVHMDKRDKKTSIDENDGEQSIQFLLT